MQLIHSPRLGLVEAVAVGAFDLEDIDVFGGFWITEDFISPAADIAREQVADMASSFLDIEQDLGGAEDVARVEEGEVNAAAEWHFSVIVERNELANGHLGILSGVERFDRRKALLGALFGNELSISTLNCGGILQHDAG